MAWLLLPSLTNWYLLCRSQSNKKKIVADVVNVTWTIMPICKEFVVKAIVLWHHFIKMKMQKVRIVKRQFLASNIYAFAL